MDEKYAPYASLDELASRRVHPDSAISLAGIVSAVLLERTDLAIEPPLVAAPVTLVAGTAAVMTVMATDGVEYEVFVRERAN